MTDVIEQISCKSALIFTKFLAPAARPKFRKEFRAKYVNPKHPRARRPADRERKEAIRYLVDVVT